MNLKRGWGLRIRERVWKALAKFPKKDQERIVKVIEEELSLDPHLGDVEKMKGREQIWRRRVGAYRLFYEIYPDERIIHLFHVERRTSKTY